MRTVKILHLADIHIGAAESFLSEKAESRRYETLITFEKIVNLAAENGVQVIAAAGDIFDSNTVESNFIEGVFNKIAEKSDIKFVFAAGNHDPLDSRSPFLNRKLPENLYVLSPRDDCKVFDDIGLCVYGRSFDSMFLKGEERFTLNPAREDYVNLMVQHGELKSDLNSDYNAITREFIINSGMDYIALGHIHKRTEIGKLGETYFAYSGCPEGQGFDETGEKGVYLGEIGKSTCELEFIPVARRKHIVEKIDILGISDSGEIAAKITDTLKEKYGEYYSENLYKIELIGSIPPETPVTVSEIQSRLSDKVYYIKIKDSTEPCFDLEALSNVVSLKGIFVKNMLKAIENANEDKKVIYKNALKIGLKAFIGEVGFNED